MNGEDRRITVNSLLARPFVTHGSAAMTPVLLLWKNSLQAGAPVECMLSYYTNARSST
jgi:hypothetical protein